MSRTLPLAGFALTAAAATIALAPAALAESAAPSPRPSVPTLEASAVPSGDVAVPRPSQTNGRGGIGDIEVPAGKAETSAPDHSNDALLVALAGGGALLLAGGAVVVVSRLRA